MFPASTRALDGWVAHRETFVLAHRPPTVGLLLNSVTDPQDAEVWAGVAEAARERSANLLCLDCGYGAHPGGICDLVGPETFDGLVMYLRDREGRPAAVLQQAHSLPVVNLAQLHEGYPGIVSGHYEGMRRLLRHLIEVHGYERLAFVQEAASSRAADARYRAYVDVIAEYGLPHNADLVVRAQSATETGRNLGEEATRLLLDVRRARPDAIVCSADTAAIDVTRALSARGVHVPGDVAVTGFDDLRESRTVRLPLTTVAQPWRRMGRRALELVLAQLGGDPVPAQMVVPCELVVRESCGCWPQTVGEVGAAVTPGVPWAARRELMLAQLSETLAEKERSEAARTAARLVDALSAVLLGDDSAVFLNELRQDVQAPLLTCELSSTWQSVLSILRRHLLASPDVRGNSRDRAESAIEQARILVCEMAVRAQAARAREEIQRAEEIERVSRTLSAHFDVGRLSSLAARELPKLGVTSLYVCLYEAAVAPSAQGRLVAGFDGEGPLELEYDGRRFPLRGVFPQGLLKGRPAYAFLLEPLASAGQQLGYALFEADPGKSAVCASLRSQLSEALRGTLLLRQTERDALQLQTAAEVGRAVSSILDPDVLMQTVVDLVLERLGLYYAGLFLVEEDGTSTGESKRWAVLRAGTGQAGARMLAERHRLEVGGTSMVGQCIAQGKARIALDAGKEAMRYDNPLLPYTCSELALPLVSRERPIGAMTIQSVEAGAFSTQDVAALQLMADQLANAIETARLYARTREALRHTQTLYETSRALSSARGEAATLHAILDGLSRQSACVYAALFSVDQPRNSFELLGGTWRGERDALPEWLAYPRSFEQDGLLTDACLSGTTRFVHGWDERIDPRHYRELGIHHLVRVLAPLRRRDEPFGVVELGYDAAEAGAVDARDTEWLAAILDQAMVALENARLWGDTQRSLDDAERMYRASQTVAMAGSVADLLRAVTEGVGEGAADCAILWTIQEGAADGIPILLSVANWSGANRPLPWPTGTRLKATEMSPLWTSERLDEVYVPDLDDDGCVTERARLALRQWGAACAALVPIRSGARVLGAILLATRGRHGFHPHEVRRIGSLAGQLAVGMERLELLRQLEQRLGREQVLREVSDRVRGAIDVESVMRTTVEEVGRLLGRPTFFQLRGDADALVTWRLEAGAGDLPSHSLSVPVQAGGATIGVLGVSGDPQLPLTEDDRQLLESISRQASEALQRARLLEEARERARRERLIRDISDRMQRATDLETLTRAAAEGVVDALGASHVYVRMGTSEGLGEE